MLEIKVEEMFEKQVQKAAVIKSRRKSAQSRDMRSGTNVIYLWFFTLCALPAVARPCNQISLKTEEIFLFLLSNNNIPTLTVTKFGKGRGRRAIHT